jgi:4-hydroxybenzoate polyprenyltransferase
MNKVLIGIYHSQVWIAIMAIALSTYYQWIARPTDTWDFYRILIIGLTTFCAYLYINMISAKDKTLVETKRLKFTRDHLKKLKMLFALITTTIIFMLFQLTRNDLFLLLGCSTIVIIYERLTPRLSLRKVPFLKTPLVSLSWAIMGVLFSTQSFSFILFFDCFIFVTALMIAFDIRDTEIDKKENIKSFVSLLGVPSAKILGFTLLLTSSYLQFTVLKNNGKHLFIEFILLTLYMILIKKVKINQENPLLYMAFDSLMLLRLLHLA